MNTSFELLPSSCMLAGILLDLEYVINIFCAVLYSFVLQILNCSSVCELSPLFGCHCRSVLLWRNILLISLFLLKCPMEKVRC